MKTTNNKNRRKIAASAAMAVASIALLMGLTFAWFTDSVTNKGNAIQAGTLSIELNDGATEPLFSSNDLWEPGFSQKAAVKLENTGSLWLKYGFRVQDVKETTPEGKAPIAEALDVYRVAKAVDDVTAGDLTADNIIGTVAQLADGSTLLAEDGVLPAAGEEGSVQEFALVVKMRESAGNEYQGCGISFTIAVAATQTPHEVDGFGSDQYDANVPLPWDGKTQTPVEPDAQGNYGVSTASDLAWLASEINSGAMKGKLNNKTIALEDDVNLGGKSWKSIDLGKSGVSGLTLDGGGHTIYGLNAASPTAPAGSIVGGYGIGLIGNATGAITIKNLHVDGAVADPAGLQRNVVGVVLGYTYGTTVFENVSVTNSTINGFGKCGALLGMGADPGVSVTFMNCTSTGNTFTGAYNLGGLAGLIQRKAGVDNTVIEGCTVASNIHKPYSSKWQYETLDSVEVAYTANDLAAGTATPRTISGSMWISGGAYWTAYSNLYNSYGNSSYDAPIAGKTMPLANSEIPVNDPSQIPGR